MCFGGSHLLRPLRILVKRNNATLATGQTKCVYCQMKETEPTSETLGQALNTVADPEDRVGAIPSHVCGTPLASTVNKPVVGQGPSSSRGPGSEFVLRCGL
jgi:hypothetical protein